jgi:hypothetical protein
MGSLFVKKDGDADDVKTGFEDFEKDFKRYAPKLSLCLTYWYRFQQIKEVLKRDRTNKRLKNGM